MWPTAIQLTRDECRGILRRLELESYSNVISVFRAQGTLSDTKSKVLEDLRNLFHISQERHRAEARRVANDEQLATIAEVIYGPNTWQDWSREGRRTFPLLPRVPPQTALVVAANHIATEVTIENSKLPYPADTGAIDLPHQEFSTSLEDTNVSVPIVTSDPFKPEVPDFRETLKRSLPPDTKTCMKKRMVSPPPINTTANNLPICSTAQIQKLYHNHSKTQSNKRRNALLKKIGMLPPKRTAISKKRINNSLAASLRKANKIHNGHAQFTKDLPTTNITKSVQSVVTNTKSESESTHTGELLQTPKDSSIDSHDKTKTTNIMTSSVPTATPQIATSKKDISKNLAKLSLNVSVPLQQLHQTFSDKISECKTEKLSTPVQKYIVEERAPILPISNTAKLKTINTKSLIPSATKPKITNLRTLKGSEGVLTPTVSNQQHVLNLIDATPSHYIASPLTTSVNVNNKHEPEHGKVLTTKLLPMMLSSVDKVDPNSNVPTVHHKNITNLNSSGPTTPIRKPNIIKSNVKQKIQITSHQIISPPGMTNLRFPPTLNLKAIPSGGFINNRKNLKLFSSPNGKMFIQPADNTLKQVNKVNTVVATQKVLTPMVNASSGAGRIQVQKVQIIPAPSSASSSNLVPKSMGLSKPSVVFMPTTSGVNSLPIVKNSKFNTTLSNTVLHEGMITSGGSSKSNVFVIGSVQGSTQPALQAEVNVYNKNSMITEDTPVDILNTPIIVDVDDFDVQSAKSTDTGSLSALRGTHSQVPTRTPISTVPQQTVLQTRVPFEECYVESSAKNGSEKYSRGEEVNGQFLGDDSSPIVIDATDWEMELDQEANKARALNANSADDIVLNSRKDDGITSEHFTDDDVIEEQEDTEEELDDSYNGNSRTPDDSKEMPFFAGTNSHDHRHQHYHHHHLHDDEDEPIEVGEEQMKADVDVIQYDETYDLTNDDMDDNIAIEYVEDQDNYEVKIDSTSSSKRESMPSSSNVPPVKQSTSTAVDQTEARDNKCQTKDECRVSVEEISSTTQQNTSILQDEH